jgi:hypothetical protein
MASKTVYFLARLDWKTGSVQFAPYSEEGASLYDGLGPDETLHRCSVELTTAEHSGGGPFISREHYVESDYIPPQEITAEQILNRIHPCRVAPVLPTTGVSMYIFNDGPNTKRVEFAGRKFEISVREV